MYYMKYLKFLPVVLLTAIFVLSACTKDEFKPDPLKEKESLSKNYSKNNAAAQQNEGLIVLGNQLEDPYALKNMKKAYSNLKTANPSLPDVDIQPTHLYLRFLPSNEEEWGLLKSDTSLVLYDYPLNFEITNLGTYYQDPSIADSAINLAVLRNTHKEYYSKRSPRIAL